MNWRAVEDPVLEQVADAAGAVREQLAGVQLLDVLGQHQDGQAGDLAAGVERGAQALVGERRRQPDVDHGDVGPLLADRREQVGGVVDGGADLEAAGLEHPRQALPQEEEVFGDDNAHGISRVAMVGPPGGLVMVSVPSKAASRRSMPARPLPRAGSAPPRPLSRTSAVSLPALVLQPDPGPAGAGVLAGVGEQLADREVGGGLDRWLGPGREPAGDLDRQAAVQGQGADRVGQAAVGQHGRVDAADQVTQLGQRPDRGLAGLGEQRPGRRRVVVEHLLRGVEGHAHGDQPGLGAIVQVPLDPPDLAALACTATERVRVSCCTRNSSSAREAGASSQRASRP